MSSISIKGASSLHGRSRPKRQKSVWVTLCPVVLSFITILMFGVYLVVNTLGSYDSVNSPKQVVSNSLPEGSNVIAGSGNDADELKQLKGDAEAVINTDIIPLVITDRDKQVFRKSLTLPDSVQWPKLINEPIDQYPVYNSLYDILSSWNPDIPDTPPIFRETLQHFNYSDPAEREKAGLFRDAEIPFKLYDVPDVDSVTSKWTDQYLLSQVGGSVSGHVEKSKNNHFMYWTGRGKLGFTPPTTIVKDMTFAKWLDLAHDAESKKLSNETEHFYFMTNSAPRDIYHNFISADLKFLSAVDDNFFITNKAANKGIQCRFGMRGVIAEAHYDSGRNMVAMIKGAKRYILTPPSTCEKLGIITDPSHPSYRHSKIDWSNLDEAKKYDFQNVPAIDTIVQTGEVLYIPSFWFHYIVSLRYSVQCNSRSGTPPKHDGKRHIEECLNLKLDFDKYNGKKKNHRLRIN